MSKNSGSILIILAAVLWGIDGVIRRSLYSLPPITIVFYEHLIGLIILLPFFIPLLTKERLTRKEWWAITFVALLSGVLGTLFFTTALQKVNFIPFSVVFLLQKLQPLFAVATARIVLGEKLERRYIKWAVVAVIAAYFVTFPNGVVNLATGKTTVVAALFALGAAAAWGSSTAFSRFVLRERSNTFVTGIRFTLTAIFALVGVLIFAPANLTSAVPTVGQFGRLVAIALSTGMVALWIYYQGLKRTEVKVATILELVFPLTGVLIDVVFYHNILAVSQYIAAAVLLFAVSGISRIEPSVSHEVRE